MKQELEVAIAAVVRDSFDITTEVLLTRPDEQFGDYATNVALRLAKQVGQNPHDIAEILADQLRVHLAGQVSDVTVAGPGFLNLTLTDSSLAYFLQAIPTQTHADQEILVEFGDPNPFKEMHLGHLYTSIVGGAIARLLEASGAVVRQLSYHGDVGMHVAKAIWAIQQRMLAEPGKPVAELFGGDETIGAYYAKGSAAFDTDETAQEAIKQVNAHIYAQDNKQVTKIYEAGKRLSFETFDKLFAELGLVFTKRYLESDSSKEGLAQVQSHTPQVFTVSEGAVVYKGEKAGLHTRVFINSRGLPTYEAKDLGLAELKNHDFPEASESIIITAHEQTEYFKVMLAALAEIDASLAAKTRHIAHGFLVYRPVR